jgi:adenosylcobinamide kinase/adenosylcobinamide-phosphate guanylyltransferase
MRVRLLGTGSAEGWPSPWCSCGSCRAAARAGVLRSSSSALVDDRLLLELGPDAPRAAVRAGTDLTGVEAVLVTHAHPDHFHWAGLDVARLGGRQPPVVLVAPPACSRRRAPPRPDGDDGAAEPAAGTTWPATRCGPSRRRTPDRRRGRPSCTT